MNKLLTKFGLAFLVAISMTGCQSDKEDTSSSSEETKDSSEMFTSRDLDSSYEEGTAISFENESVSSDGDGVEIDGTTVTINQEGTYILSGSTDNGQVIVDVDDSAKVQLVLDTVSISNENSAALYVKNADKVFVTMAQYSYNHLNNTSSFVSDEANIDGAVFSKSDITFNGDGNLEITSSDKGIVGKDDVKITYGNYTISAASKGIEGKDSVRVADGTITISAGSEGIQSENTEDFDKGFVYILNGTLNITSTDDGIEVSNYIDVENGDITIVSNGGNENGAKSTNPGFGDFGHDDFSNTTESENSCKGMKADTSIIINDGIITIDSADDSLHSDGDITINEGTISLKTGDDGIHANSSVNINDGELTVETSYEGIEGNTVSLNGGVNRVVASDDGINAQSELNITGSRTVINASGDGVDSNGTLTMSNGTIYVNAPDNGGNGIIDYGTTAEITGGTLIGCGASGMNENFTDASIGCILLDLSSSQEAGTTISLEDSKGNVLENYTSEKSYSTVLICSPSMEKGGSYTVNAGEESTSVDLSDWVYSNASGMQGGGMQGGKPGGF